METKTENILPQTSIEKFGGEAELTNDKFFNRLFTFDYAKPRLKRLIASWKLELDESITRRAIRKIEVNIKDLQEKGDLKRDEVLIAIRVIDENIREEQPQYINFAAQSKRLIIVKDEVDPTQKHEDIEEYFSAGMRYDNWLSPFIKVVDGAQTHGWDFVEIEHDPSRPLKLSISHVGHENLIFDLEKIANIEDAEEILRRFEMTVLSFEELSKRQGFNIEIVERILSRFKEESSIDQKDEILIFKRWHKFQGEVYVSWFADCKEDQYSHDWLKPPIPLILGDFKIEQKVEQVPVNRINPLTGVPEQTIIPQEVSSIANRVETVYPVKPFIYMEDEEKKLRHKHGRVYLDRPKQDAQIALWSSTINTATRSARVYGSPDVVDPLSAGQDIQKIDLELEQDCIYNKKISWWSHPPPDYDLIRISQALDARNKQERGGLATSVVNRDDSRKTAKELQIAETKEANLSSIQVIGFSGFFGTVYKTCFRLIRGLIAQGALQPPQMIAQKILLGKFNIVPAGDIDVVKREEKLRNRFMMWPMVAGVPGLAVVFLSDMLAEMFPDDAAKYTKAIAASEAQSQMIKALMEMLVTAIVNPETGELKPEFKEFEPQLLQMEKEMGVDIINNSLRGKKGSSE